MKAIKRFAYYDYAYFAPPWGAAVSVMPSGNLYHYKAAGSAKRLPNGETLIEVYTRSGFVAFGQLNRRTGKEKIKYYEVLEDGRPIEVTAYYIMTQTLAIRYQESKPSFLDLVPDRRLIIALEKRGYRLTAAHRHQSKLPIIEVDND